MQDVMRQIQHEAMLAKWAELIDEQKSSCQNVVSWCAERGITRSTYNNWLSKVKAAGIQTGGSADKATQIVCEERGSEFVRISLKQEDTGNAPVPMMRIMIGEASCEIYKGADACVVGRAIGALAASL